jgi:hypothetical protein
VTSKAGIKVQRFDADAADAADQADRSSSRNHPRAGQKDGFLVVAKDASLRTEQIRPIRSIRRIRVEPLNLDASPTVRCEMS